MKKGLVKWSMALLFGLCAVGVIQIVHLVFGTSVDWLDVWLAATASYAAGLEWNDT